MAEVVVMAHHISRGCFVVVFAVYIGAFLYLLVHDRDALRSETYSLRKMALQHGAAGDSLSGILETDEARQVSTETGK